MTGSRPRASIIAKWEEHFPFSHLRALNILYAEIVNSLPSLYFRLDKLERLSLSVSKEQWVGSFNPAENVREADYKSLLAALKPLKMLRVRGAQKNRQYTAFPNSTGKHWKA